MVDVWVGWWFGQWVGAWVGVGGCVGWSVVTSVTAVGPVGGGPLMFLFLFFVRYTRLAGMVRRTTTISGILLEAWVIPAPFTPELPVGLAGLMPCYVHTKKTQNRVITVN